jgi:hypothetical protein
MITRLQSQVRALSPLQWFYIVGAGVIGALVAYEPNMPALKWIGAGVLAALAMLMYYVVHPADNLSTKDSGLTGR